MRHALSFCATALLIGTVSWSSAAHAHAVLLGSSPEADQVLDTSPAEVVLNFNENVGPIFIKVLDLAGSEVGSPTDWSVKGNDVFMPLGDTLENGTYILTYRVISADTHPVGSTLVFAVGEPIQDTSDVAAEGGGTTAWTWAVAANRTFLYASMLLTAGSALLLLLMSWPANAITPIASQGRIAAIIAAVTYVLAIGFGGAEMVMGGIGAVFSLETWSQGVRSTLLPSALIGLPGVAILFFTFRPSGGTPSAAMLLVGAALTIGSFLVTGHAATAPPAWLMAVIVAVHLVCAAFWFAALRPLWLSTRSGAVQDAGHLMVQFSQRAVWTVAALFLTGAVITFVQVETPANMVATDYGIRLIVKILLFFALLSLAALNKRQLTPKLEAGDAQGAASLRKSITLEYVLIVMILIAAVTLTLPSPPRTALAQAAGAVAGSESVKASGENRGYVVQVEITPGRTGENMVMFSFTDSTGAAVEMQRVDTLWSLPAAGLEGIERPAEKVSAEMFHLTTSDLILPGEWTVRVSAYVDDFTKINIPVIAEIR
jgi:copper transport protein